MTDVRIIEPAIDGVTAVTVTPSIPSICTIDGQDVGYMLTAPEVGYTDDGLLTVTLVLMPTSVYIGPG